MTFSLVATIARDGALDTRHYHRDAAPWNSLSKNKHWFRMITTAVRPDKMAAHLCAYPSTVAIADGTRNDGLWHHDGNAVIMDLETWEDLDRPLSSRFNFVVSLGAMLCSELSRALADAASTQGEAFVIGGAQLYAEALQHPDLGALYITEVDAEYPDVHALWPATFVPDDTGPYQRITKQLANGRLRHWHRKNVSAWVEEPERPRYRLGIWKEG